jgi:7-cyano-7-deazaguanine synthase
MGHAKPPGRKAATSRFPARHRVCALVSGGLDSCVMLAELARRFAVIHPVYMREGLAWEEAEIRALRRYLRALPASVRCSVLPLRVLSLPVGDVYAGHWSLTGRRAPDATTADDAMYLPGRNLLMLSKAAVYCARHKIPVMAVGSLRRNPFTDATTEFLREMARLASVALGWNLRVVAPFHKLSKVAVIGRATKWALPVHLSFSCVSPRLGRHCGRCNKCAERQRAFAGARTPDKTLYADG